MPVIIAHIKPEWLNASDPDDHWSPQQKLMSSIVKELRSMTANTVNEINRKGPRFQRAFGPEDAILDVLLVHPWAENVPDLRLEIFVDETEAAQEASRERCWSIARDVSGQLFHYLDQVKFLAGPCPTYSVECTARASSGIIRDSHGALKLNWGVPDYSQT